MPVSALDPAWLALESAYGAVDHDRVLEFMVAGHRVEATCAVQLGEWSWEEVTRGPLTGKFIWASGEFEGSSISPWSMRRWRCAP